MEWHRIGVRGREDPLCFGEAKWPYRDFMIHTTSFWLTKILCGKSNTMTRKDLVTESVPRGSFTIWQWIPRDSGKATAQLPQVVVWTCQRSWKKILLIKKRTLQFVR
jgi:hypothetical protein